MSRALIHISTTTSNANAPIRIRPGVNTRIRNASARVSRTATLDGGTVLTHSGFADGDMTFDVRTSALTRAEAEALWGLFKDETGFTISCEEGCFEGAIQRLNLEPHPVRFKFYVKERLSS